MGVGTIVLYVGCMFAGKTSRLIETLEVLATKQTEMLIIKHSSDDRYSSEPVLVTHTGKQYPCVPRKTLMPLLEQPEFLNSSAIMVDEGQFFPDLYDFARISAECYGKDVYVGALDTNYKRKLFPEIAKLMAISDETHKLFAKCYYCGSKALFSMKLDESIKEHIGGADMYRAVCRKHYCSNV